MILLRRKQRGPRQQGASTVLQPDLCIYPLHFLRVLKTLLLSKTPVAPPESHIHLGKAAMKGKEMTKGAEGKGKPSSPCTGHSSKYYFRESYSRRLQFHIQSGFIG